MTLLTAVLLIASGVLAPEALAVPALPGAPTRASGVPAPEAEIVAAAMTAMAEAWPQADAEIRVVQLSPSVQAASPPVRVQFASGETPRGRVSVDVYTQDADGLWRRAGWAYIHVARFETVAVLARDVARGDTLSPADVALRRTETTDLRDDPLAPEARPAGLVFRRALREGTVLTARHVEAPLAVRLGDAVRVRYQRGDFSILLDTEAREPAAFGDTLRVYCSSTRSTYRVRLVASGEAEWIQTL